MTEEKTPNKHGATPGKLALIGVLSVVLLFVVYRNLIRGSADSDVAVEREDEMALGEEAGRVDDKRATPRSSAFEKMAARLRSRPWPTYLPGEVGVYDPFALPSGFPRPPETNSDGNDPLTTPATAVAALATEKAKAAAIAAIRQQGVQIVFKHADEFVAVIGDREVRVGDEVAGYVVVEIDTDGIDLDDPAGMEAK